MALTQREWSAILVAGWRGDHSLHWALARVAGALPGEKLSPADYRAAAKETHDLYPFVEHVFGGTPIRRFVASRSKFASDALFDGDEKKALALMEKRCQDYRASYETKAKKEWRKESGRTKFVAARQIDKRYDWATVK